MFRLLRYFALSSLLFVSIAAVLLAVFSQYVLNQTLLEHGKEENQAIAAVLGSQFEQQARSLLEIQDSQQQRLMSQWIEQRLNEQFRGSSVDSIKLYDHRGRGLFQSASIELPPPLPSFQQQALLSGQIISDLLPVELDGQLSQLVVTLIPLTLQGQNIDAVVAIASDVTALYQRSMSNRIMLGAASALVMLMLYVVLYIIVRYADRELKNQHQQLQQSYAEQNQIKLKLEQRAIERTQLLNKEIAERRQIEQSLREHESYLQAVMANIFNGIICIDMRGIILSFNPTAEKMFGYSHNQVVGQNVSMLMPANHAVRHDGYINNYLDTGKAAIIGSLRELKALRSDGSTFPMELAITETQVAGESIFVGTIRDISEYKKSERALLDARQKYYHQEKMAAIGFLSAGLVHEIGNPVSAISGLLDGLCNPDNDGLGCSKLANSQLRLAQEQVERIIKITRDVSEFATPQTHESELQDLNNLIGRTSRLMRHDRRFTDVEVRLELDNQIPAIFGVSDHLVQVLMNLLVNAVDAVTERGISQGVILVRSGSEADSDRVWFEVCDNGCGMNPQVLEQANEAFFTTKSVGKGTGLGLSLCESLLVEQGGTMTIESEVGVGTQVRVSLPTQPTTIEIDASI